MAPYDALRDGRRDEAELEREFRSEALEFAGDHPLYPPRVVLWASVRMLNLADPELERLSVREAGAAEWLRAANRFAIWALVLAAVAGTRRAGRPLWLWLFPGRAVAERRDRHRRDALPHARRPVPHPARRAGARAMALP